MAAKLNWLRRCLIGPAVATQFLTVLPVNPGVEVDGQLLAKSMAHFPLVGLAVGAIELVVYLALSRFLPTAACGALLLVVALAVTGGIHLDGLADSSDGIFSGRSRERMLEIMKDSRVGSFGVMAIAAFLIVRYALLVSGLELQPLWVLLAPPVLARVSPVCAALRCSYARVGDGGSGKPYTEYVTWRTLAGSASFALLFVACMGYTTGRWDMAVGVPAVGWGLAWAFNRYIIHKLGGVTGDTFGALLCVTELGCLCGAIALAVGP